MCVATRVLVSACKSSSHLEPPGVLWLGERKDWIIHSPILCDTCDAQLHVMCTCVEHMCVCWLVSWGALGQAVLTVA